jgi:hypothetical protein
MSGVVKIEIRETEEELKSSSEERERCDSPRKTASPVLAQDPNCRNRIIGCCAA